MPPVPIYTKSPINAAKADGVTPQTSAASEKDQLQPATTTAAATQQQGGYPAARPGTVPFLPTQTTATSSQQYAPVQPTPTRNPGDRGPPPPQPGAVPVAPGATAQAPAYGPPLPRVTNPPTLPEQRPAAYPQQMSIPAPTVPQAQRGTSTAFVVPYSSGQAPDQIAHPPGYHQNVNASEFTSSQEAEHGGASQASSDWRASHDRTEDDEEGVWNAARKWAQAAGEKLSAAETEVWRRINKKE